MRCRRKGEIMTRWTVLVWRRPLLSCARGLTRLLLLLLLPPEVLLLLPLDALLLLLLTLPHALLVIHVLLHMPDHILLPC